MLLVLFWDLKTNYIHIYIYIYIYICVCGCVCVCVCVRARVFVTYEDTNLYNDMGVT